MYTKFKSEEEVTRVGKMTLEDLGSILKNFRKERGLTQKEVAEKIHVARNTISKWEDGTLNPGFLHIYNLCQAFDITIDELLGTEKKKYITLIVSQDDIEKFHTTIQKFEETLTFIFPTQDTKLQHQWAELKRIIELFLLNTE